MKKSSEWISISDLMSGLMMVFLFISILFMVNINQEKLAIERIALTYDQSKHRIHEALNQEFKDDFHKWDAVLLPDNTIRFQSPRVLFDTQSTTLKDHFKEILDDFFPRYVKVLTKEEFREEIEEVRIEGHTDRYWQGASTLKERFLNNSQLSQGRTHAVLEYCFKNEKIKKNREWLIQTLRANGLAFAKPVLDSNKKEDSRASRRVEFKVKTRVEDKVEEILVRIKK